jgi:complement component 1 Q subcomponent-binding protein
LSIDAVCQEGTFVLENVSFYKDAELATDLTAESDWKRRGLYLGPQVRSRVFFFTSSPVERAHSQRAFQFDTLDLNLQEEFEKFLQERGINESLAFFIPEYAQYKEQKARSVVIFQVFVQ